MENPTMTRAMQRLTHDEVVKAAGPLDDVSIAEIIATGATIEELEEAVTWANGVTRLGRELGRPLSRDCTKSLPPTKPSSTTGHNRRPGAYRAFRGLQPTGRLATLGSVWNRVIRSLALTVQGPKRTSTPASSRRCAADAPMKPVTTRRTRRSRISSQTQLLDPRRFGTKSISPSVGSTNRMPPALAKKGESFASKPP